MWFLDAERSLLMVARPHFPMWIADKNNLITYPNIETVPLTKLRKRYES